MESSLALKEILSHLQSVSFLTVLQFQVHHKEFFRDFSLRQIKLSTVADVESWVSDTRLDWSWRVRENQN